MASPSQSMPSQVRPSRIASIAALVERSRSVSSIRNSILPPRPRAYNQLNSAVRAPPIWRNPVGEGAKRVTTVSDILEVGQGLRWVGARPCTTAWGSGVTQILAGALPALSSTLGGSGQIWHIDPIFGSGLGTRGRATGPQQQ